jgi:hypothetical protein
MHPHYNGAGSKLDRNRLGKILARLDSPFDDEALSAARMGGRMLSAAGMAWQSLVDPYRDELETAIEATRILLAENIELRAEVERLRAAAGRPALAWQDVGINKIQAAARWLAELHDDGEIWLSEFEIQFIGTLTRQTRPLSPKQDPIFRRIVERVFARTGMSPPGWDA